MNDSVPEHSNEQPEAKMVRVGDVALEHVRDNIWVVVDAREWHVPAKCDPFAGPQGTEKIQYFIRPVRQPRTPHDDGQTAENS